MKKLQDWNIKLGIKIDNNYKNIEIVCSIHTNIHAIKLQILKILQLPLFDTNVQIFYHSHEPLKHVSTLLQNGIKDNTHLRAVIQRVKKNEPLNVGQSVVKKKPEYVVDQKIQMLGLTMTCMCSNQKQINYGYGTFPILQLVSGTKCEFCPYKNQHIRPSMLCKEVKVNKCHFLLSGTIFDRGGIPVPKKTSYIKAHHPKRIQKLLQAEKYHKDLEIIVKQL